MPHCLRWGGMASLLGGLGDRFPQHNRELPSKSPAACGGDVSCTPPPRGPPLGGGQAAPPPQHFVRRPPPRVYGRARVDAHARPQRLLGAPVAPRPAAI